MSDLEEFRGSVRSWCRDHIPSDWRAAETGVSDEAFVDFQQHWFQELRSAGYAVPHWPAEWGGGMSTAEQVVLYQELAAADAPRLVMAFVSIHHAASTLLMGGTAEQQQRHLPAILDGEIWCQGFSEPGAGSDLASLSCAGRQVRGGYEITGQKVWVSGALHADWCLLLARTEPDAPKRQGISYFLTDMRSPGLDVRTIRQATGESHFCELFLDEVFIPEANLVGPAGSGWQVAQSTLSAERGMTMLELAERLGNAGFGWLVEACGRPGLGGDRPIDDPVVQDRLAAFDTEIAGLRSLCRSHVDRSEAGTDGPADASIVKLYYSELLQRMTDFGAEIVGMGGQTVLQKPISSGWESGVWVLDFISSWEWTIPGGSSEIQRTIIAERGLGLPRGIEGGVVSDLSEHHDELRSVARGLLAPVTADEVSWEQLAEVGWPGLEVPEAFEGAGATFAEAAIVIEELGRAAVASSFLGTAVLGVGALVAVVPTARRDELVRQVALGAARVAVAVAPGGDGALIDPPFRLVPSGDALQLDGRAEFVADAEEADALLLLARSGEEVVVVHVPADRATVEAQPVLDATRRFATVEVTGLTVEAGDVWTFVDGEPAAQDLVDRAALAVACDSIGIASAMLDATVAYASDRAQFGRPIGSFQAVQHACADLLVEITIGRELLAAAIEAVAAGDAEAGVHVARASSFVTAAAVDVVGAAMQLHGAIGYSWESGIHVFFKRAVLNRSLFGSPAAQRRRLSARLRAQLTTS